MSFKKILLIIFGLLIGLYLIGIPIARNKAKPYFEAQKLINEAEGQVRQKWVALTDMADKEPDKYLEAEKAYVELYERANQLNLKDFPVFEVYVRENYKLSKDLFDYDKKILSGELKITEEESKKYLEEFSKRRKDINANSYFRVPFWMSFFMIVNENIN